MQNGETMAYNIIFYENEKGDLEVWDFLELLRKKSDTNKEKLTASFIFTVMTTISYFFTVFVKRHKKHRGVKLKRQKQCVMIIYPERRTDFYENLE